MFHPYNRFMVTHNAFRSTSKTALRNTSNLSRASRRPVLIAAQLVEGRNNLSLFIAPAHICAANRLFRAIKLRAILVHVARPDAAIIKAGF